MIELTPTDDSPTPDGSVAIHPPFRFGQLSVFDGAVYRVGTGFSPR